MPSQRPPGCVRKVVKRIVKIPAKTGQRPAPALGAGRLHRLPHLRAGLRDREREDEEQPDHEDGDERRLLGREAQREQGADDRRVIAARVVQEAPDGDHQAERDRGDVDVLAREAAEVQVAGAEREQQRGGEGRDAPEQRAQQPAHRDHARAHQRGGEAGGEVRVPEQDVHQARQVEAQRPVQERVVLVVAALAEQVAEVRVLALVVVERAIAERDQAHDQRDRDQHAPDGQLARVLGLEPAGDAALLGAFGFGLQLGGVGDELGHLSSWPRRGQCAGSSARRSARRAGSDPEV